MFAKSHDLGIGALEWDAALINLNAPVHLVL